MLIAILLDESPQWLVAQKRYNDAFYVLKRVARLNRVQLDSENCNSIITSREELKRAFQINTEPCVSVIELQVELKATTTITHSLKEIFTPKRMLIKTLILSYFWLVVELSYYGIALGLGDIETINPYLLFTFEGIAELIGYCLCFINRKFGHKKMSIVYLCIGGVISVIISCIPNLLSKIVTSKQLVLAIVLFSIFKCTVSANYNTCYIYTNELYMINVRNFAITLVSCFGTLGGLCSPQIRLLGNIIWLPFPYVVYSILSFSAAVLLVYLPETV